jgi:hypothetical protein
MTTRLPADTPSHRAWKAQAATLGTAPVDVLAAFEKKVLDERPGQHRSIMAVALVATLQAGNGAGARHLVAAGHPDMHRVMPAFQAALEHGFFDLALALIENGHGQDGRDMMGLALLHRQPAIMEKLLSDGVMRKYKDMATLVEQCLDAGFAEGLDVLRDVLPRLQSLGEVGLSAFLEGLATVTFWTIAEMMARDPGSRADECVETMALWIAMEQPESPPLFFDLLPEGMLARLSWEGDVEDSTCSAASLLLSAEQSRRLMHGQLPGAAPSRATGRL